MVDRFPGGFPGADDHAGYSRRFPVCYLLLFHQEDPVAEADQGDEQELEDRADQVIGDGHPADEERRADHLDNRRGQAGADDPVHVIDAGVAPHAAVEFEGGEDSDGQHRVEGREVQPVGQVVADRGPELEVHVEADQQRQEVGGVYRDDVQEDNPEVTGQAVPEFFQCDSLPV